MNDIIIRKNERGVIIKINNKIKCLCFSDGRRRSQSKSGAIGLSGISSKKETLIMLAMDLTGLLSLLYRTHPLSMDFKRDMIY